MSKKKLFEEKPLKLEILEQLNFLKSRYKRDQKVEFVCRICQKQVIKNISHFKDFLCKTHLTEKTCLQKYGVKQILQKDSPVLEKIENIWQEKYNGRPQKDLKVKQKISQSHKNLSEEALKIKKQKKEKTCLEKYNDKSYNNSEKISQTKQNFSKVKKEEIQHKINETCLEKYNTHYPAQNKTIQLKMQQTNLKRRNVPFAAQSEEVKQKMKQTCLEKYGVENYSQTEEASLNHKHVWKLTFKKYYEANKENWVKLHTSKRFEFNTIYFDSYTELCFYLYHLDQNVDIKRNTKSFKYIFENKVHYYFPDFEIEGNYYEIKGNQFLKEDNTWQNPFDHTQDALYEAKHQCALENNVIIIYSKDCEKYIESVEKKYGKDYFRS